MVVGKYWSNPGNSFNSAQDERESGAQVALFRSYIGYILLWCSCIKLKKSVTIIEN